MPVTDRNPQEAWFAVVAGIGGVAAVGISRSQACWEGQERWGWGGTERQRTELWALPSRATWPWPEAAVWLLPPHPDRGEGEGGWEVPDGFG